MIAAVVALCSIAISRNVTVDAECQGDDLFVNGRYQKACDVTEEECEARCSAAAGCAVWVYNYRDGPNPQWNDRCCWLKSSCGRPRAMKGKKRGMVREAVGLGRKKDDGLTAAIKSLPSRDSGGVDVAAGLLLDTLSQSLGRDKVLAMVQKWLDEEDNRPAQGGEAPGGLPHFAVPRNR
eukprot:Hpha_TRINITY_DN17020_c2_g3::TRINITY_DN17020_c2_g3_i6::g.165939::m.165939